MTESSDDPRLMTNRKPNIKLGTGLVLFSVFVVLFAFAGILYHASHHNDDDHKCAICLLVLTLFVAVAVFLIVVTEYTARIKTIKRVVRVCTIPNSLAIRAPPITNS
jgi:hypothetical protein